MFIRYVLILNTLRFTKYRIKQKTSNTMQMIHVIELRSLSLSLSLYIYIYGMISDPSATISLRSAVIQSIPLNPHDLIIRAS